jgi:hypothetical protein
MGAEKYKNLTISTPAIPVFSTCTLLSLRLGGFARDIIFSNLEFKV